MFVFASAPPPAPGPPGTVSAPELVQSYPPWSEDPALRRRAEALLNERPTEVDRARRTPLPAHWSAARALAEARQGHLLCGSIRVLRPGGSRNTACAILYPDAEDGDPDGSSDGSGPVLLSGGPRVNRAMDGDRVAVALDDPSEWPAPASVRRLLWPDGEGQGEASTVPADSNNDDDDEEDEEDGVGGNEEEEDGVGPGAGGSGDLHKLGLSPDAATRTGRVVAVLTRAWRPQVCRLPRWAEEEGADGEEAPAAGGRRLAVLVIPASRRLPRFRVTTRHVDALAGTLFLAEPYAWPRALAHPLARVVAVLGPRGSQEAEIVAILSRHSLRGHTRPFPEAAVRELPRPPDPVGAAPLSSEQAVAAWLRGQQEATQRRVGGAPSGAGEGASWWSPSPRDVAARWDLRGSHLLFSVDPAGCVVRGRSCPTPSLLSPRTHPPPPIRRTLTTPCRCAHWAAAATRSACTSPT